MNCNAFWFQWQIDGKFSEELSFGPRFSSVSLLSLIRYKKNQRLSVKITATVRNTIFHVRQIGLHKFNGYYFMYYYGIYYRDNNGTVICILSPMFYEPNIVCQNHGNSEKCNFSCKTNRAPQI